jgi:hypothetical protein
MPPSNGTPLPLHAGERYPSPIPISRFDAPLPPPTRTGHGAACSLKRTHKRLADAYASTHAEHFADAQRSGVALKLVLPLTPSISLMLNAQASR